LASEFELARARAELLSLRTFWECLDDWLALLGELPQRGGWIENAREIGVTPKALYRELARNSASPKQQKTQGSQ
jgi:hypothetical protein